MAGFPYGRVARFERHQSSKMTPVGTLESGKWGKSATKLHCNDVQIPPHVVNFCMTYSKLSFWFGAGEVWQDHGAARKTVCKGDDAKAVVSQTDLFGVAYGR